MGRKGTLSPSWTEGVMAIWWKAARVGERLSPYVALACVAMAVHTLLFA